MDSAHLALDANLRIFEGRKSVAGKLAQMGTALGLSERVVFISGNFCLTTVSFIVAIYELVLTSYNHQKIGSLQLNEQK